MARRKVIGITSSGKLVKQNTPKQQEKIRKALSGDTIKNRNNKKRSSRS